MALNLDDGDERALAEINVTPLVDVMLVLLIIFMIAAPLLQQGVKVNLPRAQAEPLKVETQDPLILTVAKDGLVYLGKTPIHSSQLVERVVPTLRSRNQSSIFLKGDKDVAYGRILEVLEVLRQGGIVDVGLVTEPLTPGR
ncbi:MAG TPA: protein TolR [Thermoanaerobaculia bacterium]|nr:protein TolR [Thermoanaerobaculia bacterium]